MTSRTATHQGELVDADSEESRDFSRGSTSTRHERERPVQGRQHGALRVATRSRAAFFGRGGFHFVILRQADEFLDAPSELRDTLGIDIE